MNARLIGELVQLRYKLLWAKTRSRNGRIALFVVGYLLLVILGMLLSGGGFGAALLAVRSGKAEQVAQAVLAGIFVQAIISTTVLGFGMSAVFSETELRRYPLSAPDRRLARHIVAIADPFWFLFLAFELALAAGLYVTGAAGFWSAIAAVLLFFVGNYLLARVVAALIDQLVKRKGGTAILLAAVVAIAFLPGAIAPLLKKNPQIGIRIVERLSFTPPFAAAAAIVRPPDAAVQGFLLLLLWIVALTAALVWLEKRPPQRQTASSVKLAWESPFDRVGALYGTRLGPLVSHWLRFYTRHSKTRIMSMLAIPLLGFLTFTTSRTLGSSGLFVSALGTIGMVTFMGTSRIACNQFGYSGGAFRRYFLLPIHPVDTLRAASFAALMLGAIVLPVALIAWLVLVPLPFDPRMLTMLIASGITGLFAFNACGVWVTLFNPRKGAYDSSFGNDLSLGGNILLIGGMITALLLPRILHRFYPAAVSPASWWALIPLPLLAIVLYIVTLKLAGPVFTARRERLLAVIEGRD
jgi:hypothetical protein